MGTAYLYGSKDMTHRYCRYDSQGLHILTGTEDMTQGYCILFFYLVKLFSFNNSPFTTLQNNTINNQLQVGSICNKLIRECL